VPEITVIENVEQLEDLLSEPSAGAVEALRRLEGDLLLLGAGGKMGPSLARMARRASDLAGVRRRVVAASRYSQPGLEDWLRGHGVEAVRCDLLDRRQLAALPEAPNVIFMTGTKFGTTGREALTWAMNAYLPGLVCERFRASRVVAFSTGNVYGLTPLSRGGSVESDPLRPVGEYAQSCVGRERVFEHFSRTLGVPVVLLRLNYAAELRYGVLADLARRVASGKPFYLGMGQFNTIWQGDANAVALQAFALAESPPRVLNVTGPEVLSVRALAEEFGRLLGKSVTFYGDESDEALLSNAGPALRLFGPPRVGVPQLIAWVAEWVRRGGADLGKPTHFESRDGNF
jgi:nucleoside-diphosphate-sugar epimerase